MGGKKKASNKPKAGKPIKKRALSTESCQVLVSKDFKTGKQNQTDINEEELSRISADGSEWCTAGICPMLFFPI